MMNNELKNNLVKMFNINRNSAYHDITRRGSFDQRSTRYRRNGMLNLGSKQMVSFMDTDNFRVGMGGPPIVG